MNRNPQKKPGAALITTGAVVLFCAIGLTATACSGGDSVGSNPSFRAGAESAQTGGTAYRLRRTGMGIPAACNAAFGAATGIGPDKFREDYDEADYMRGCTSGLKEAEGE
jgi:hypothetical protein